MLDLLKSMIPPHAGPASPDPDHARPASTLPAGAALPKGARSVR
ncbi:MAG: hypothetical protein WAL72_26875 [Streptosporangiaceae bacterium]